MSKKIPILIPFKVNSVRCPRKNTALLPYTVNYLNEIGRLEDAVFITQEEFNNEYGINVFIEERQGSWCEFDSLQNYAKGAGISEFIWLPVPQPCRDLTLIDRVLEKGLGNYDMVTSYIVRQERRLFEIKDGEFIIKDHERKGCLCGEESIADGALYYMSTDFLNKVVASDNPNKAFWNSRIGFVQNHAPFVDIDTQEDLDCFLRYYK